MKKLAVFIALVGLLIVPALAHPGGTDYKGGHTDHSTGEYHYHHGYSAHDHVDGVCPYDFDDKTGEDSGSWGGGVESVYNHDGLSSVYQTLQKGDRGNDVAILQRRLNRLGYSVGNADGIFGAKTEAAVKQFQKDNGINATGGASYVTLSKLFPELVPVVTTEPSTEVVARDRQQSGLTERIHSILEILGISFIVLITIGWMPLMLLWALFIELVDRIKNARSRKH